MSRVSEAVAVKDLFPVYMILCQVVHNRKEKLAKGQVVF
jgi:hypothetical protein